MQPTVSTSFQKNKSAESFRKKFIRKIASFFQKHRKKKIAGIIILLLLVYIIIRSLSGPGQIVLVSTGEVTVSGFEKSVFASGKLEVKDKQEFYAENKTTVEEILAKSGEPVSKGQVILKTDTGSLRVEVAKNRLSCQDLQAKIIKSESDLRLLAADYELAQQEYENAKILFDNGAISSKELKDTEKKLNELQEKLTVERDANLPLLKSQLAQAELVYADSQKRLEKATVVSPMDGVLLNLPVKVGQELQAGTLLAQIGNPDKLQIETGINEIDAAQLQVGDRVEITNSALLAKPLSGKIEFISPIAEVVATSQGEQTQVKIRIAVDETEELKRIKPGFNVNYKVILEQKEQAMLVPYEAVVQSEGKSLVYLVGKDNTVTEREIQTGVSNELFFEVLSGLSAGDKVVLNPPEEMKDGMKVIVNAAGK